MTLREENLKELRLLRRLVTRFGWTRRIAVRFDESYCCLVSCVECPLMEGNARMCPRPDVKGLDV